MRELGRCPLHQAALVADRSEGAQGAHRLKALEDLAGELRHLMHLAPADGLGAEAGHRHVDGNDGCRQREQRADHPAGREDHREDGRRRARGDGPPLVVMDVVTEPGELFADGRDGRARAGLLVRGVAQDERIQDRVAGTGLGRSGPAAASRSAANAPAARRKPPAATPRTSAAGPPEPPPVRRLRRSAPRHTS
jgi:hypothetical protein